MWIGGNTSPTIIQNLIYENVVTPTLSFPDPSGGAGLTIGASDGSVHRFRSFITNNTFVGNKVLRIIGVTELGSQILLDSHYDNVQLSNNLIIGMDGQPVVWCFASSSTLVGPPMFDHNDVSNLGLGSAIYSGACTDQTGQNSNISADPNFAADASSPRPYQLQLPSAAADAGDNNAPMLPQLDFLGQPRIQNAKGLSSGIVDMGVYEYPGVPATVPPPADFTLAVNPTSATVRQGQNGIFSVTVTPAVANLGTILLTCSTQPATISCMLSSPTMSFTNVVPQSSTLTIVTGTTQVGSLRRASPGDGFSIVLAGIFLIPSLLVGKRGISRKGASWTLRIGMIGAIFSCVGLSGCGPDRYILIGAPQSYQVNVQAVAVNSGLSKQTVAALVITQ
jgi:hypothetical protein